MSEIFGKIEEKRETKMVYGLPVGALAEHAELPDGFIFSDPPQISGQVIHSNLC